MPDVADHADHLEDRLAVAAAAVLHEPLAERRRRIAEQRAGHRFVDHRHQRRAGAIGAGEAPPGDQRNAHRLEVLAPDEAPAHLRRTRAGRQRPILAVHADRPRVAAHRQVPDRAHRGHPRQGRQALAGLLQVRQAHPERAVLRRGLHPEGQDAVGIEAGVDALQVPHRAQHQPGADAEHQRQRHLRGHQAAQRALAARRLGAVALPEQRLDAGPQRYQRGQQAHRNGEPDRRRQHGEEHAAVERDLGLARHFGRQPRHQEGQQRPGEGQTGQRPGRGEHDLLDEQLAHQLPPRGADGRAHGELARPLDRAAEHQRTEVGGAEQQHQPDGGEQQGERGPDRLGGGALQRRRVEGAAPVVGAPQRATHLGDQRCQFPRRRAAR